MFPFTAAYNCEVIMLKSQVCSSRWCIRMIIHCMMLKVCHERFYHVWIDGMISLFHISFLVLAIQHCLLVYNVPVVRIFSRFLCSVIKAILTGTRLFIFTRNRTITKPSLWSSFVSIMPTLKALGFPYMVNVYFLLISRWKSWVSF